MSARIAIVGSRTWRWEKPIRAILEGLPPRAVVVTGTNHREEDGPPVGADQMAVSLARELRVPCVIHEAEWDRYGKAAGPMRNQLIARDCTRMVAFWDGKSSGTSNAICLALVAHKEVTITLRDGLSVHVSDRP